MSEARLQFSKLGEDVDRATLARDRANQYMEKLDRPGERDLLHVEIAGAKWDDGSLHVQHALNTVLPKYIDRMLIDVAADLDKAYDDAIARVREAVKPDTPAKPTR